MKSWIEQLQPIINEYTDGSDEPMDGDDVDKLCLILKAKINLSVGNITENEYNDILDGKGSETLDKPKKGNDLLVNVNSILVANGMPAFGTKEFNDMCSDFFGGGTKSN